MSEYLCPVHKLATIESVCVDCLKEASDGIALIEAGVASALAWARTIPNCNHPHPVAA